MAHHEAGGVAPGDELVHLAAVDLQLLLIEAMHGVAGRGLEPDIGLGAERAVRQVHGKARVLLGALLPDIHHRRQLLISRAALVDLRRHGARIRKAVGAGKQAVEIVEAAVLQIDHHDMIDLGEAGRRLRMSRAANQSEREAGQKHPFHRIPFFAIAVERSA